MKTRLEKQAMALTAIGRLNKRDLKVIDKSNAGPVPVIYIQEPDFKLWLKSTSIQERHNGVVSYSSVVRFGGCIVRWRDDNKLYLEWFSELINPYSPELINSWPKHF